MWTWFYKLASPPYVYGAAAALTPWFLATAALAIGYGLAGGLIFAPPDYQQGDAFRIIYVHAPSAWLSLFAYSTMAIAGAIALVWRIKIGHAVAAASAPIGASFTLLALFTGSLWGRPMWGTYWAWDPRLTSELILLFLYVGVMSLRSAFEDPARGDRAAALLAIVGIVNVPIIHFSVQWWNSLHQGATVAKFGKSEMPASMLLPLLSMLLGFMFFYGAVLCMRLQGEVLNRERQAKWVREAIKVRQVLKVREAVKS
jgi:heme exporter protein C